MKRQLFGKAFCSFIFHFSLHYLSTYIITRSWRDEMFWKGAGVRKFKKYFLSPIANFPYRFPRFPNIFYACLSFFFFLLLVLKTNKEIRSEEKKGGKGKGEKFLNKMNKKKKNRREKTVLHKKYAHWLSNYFPLTIRITPNFIHFRKDNALDELLRLFLLCSRYLKYSVRFV